MPENNRVLKIFGKTFPVVRKDILTTEGNYGLFDLDKIILDTSLEGEELIATEVHEFIHAVADRLGLNLTSIHVDLWEIIAEGISRALVESYNISPKEVLK